MNVSRNIRHTDHTTARPDVAAVRNTAAQTLASCGGSSTHPTAQRLEVPGPAADYGAVAALASCAAQSAAAMVPIMAEGGNDPRAARLVSIACNALDAGAGLFAAMAGEHPAEFSTDDAGPRSQTETEATAAAREGAARLLRQCGGPSVDGAAGALGTAAPHRDYAAISALCSIAAQSLNRLACGAVEEGRDPHAAHHRLLAAECLDGARRFLAALPLPGPAF